MQSALMEVHLCHLLFKGAYSIYRALAVAIGQLPVEHVPNLTNTEPVVDFKPQPGWFDPEKVVFS